MAIDAIGPGAYALALGGGLVSFASPCVLPLVPAYLSVVTGLEVAELRESRRDRVVGVVRDTGLFVAGFTAVFTALGLSATTLGRSVAVHQLVLTRLSGVVVMAMGLFLLGSLVVGAPWMFREFRLHPRLGRFGAVAPLVAGRRSGSAGRRASARC
ncbi:MAG TPA: cytochrome c biogenesis protein CcdA [Gemmataceae bacterium]|nr:cytochrome c biogenesis protein CcdA [Gemmataceae bacterium]